MIIIEQAASFPSPSTQYVHLNLTQYMIIMLVVDQVRKLQDSLTLSLDKIHTRVVLVLTEL